MRLTVPDNASLIKPQPIDDQSCGLKIKKCIKNRTVLFVGGLILAVIVGSAAGSFAWYNNQLRPVGSDISQLKLITIENGSTPGQVGRLLESESIIRSSTAFDIYARLSGRQNKLQAGMYRLSPAESTPQIVEHLVNGSVDEFSITFYPGATLVDNTDAKKKYDVTTVLRKAEYSDEEIAAAFKASYDSPLFASRPAGADLEGYIYGQTYNFSTGAKLTDILSRTFEEFYSVVQENNLVKKFSDHGLNLYQGITLASIVQREASDATEQKQVAQVFYSRLKLGMILGSDVTYQYIADKTGVPRDTNLDSPYNTRRFGGLPPGPIASPGLSALLAVANPASGDYLYFLAGDDDKVYFAKTLAEHEANIINHCAVKCSTP
ncbi:MAG: endolytic transglycosylase MltG [Candidatus Saccharimonadales bacterium]